jgi:hypothetical protein
MEASVQTVIEIFRRSFIFLIFGALSFALAAPTRAQQITFGTGLVCDQLDDVERYMTLDNEGDNVDGVLDEVNHEAERVACDVVTVAYIRGEDMKLVHITGGFGAIAKVVVVGVHTGTEWLSVGPMEKFMIVSLGDREA